MMKLSCRLDVNAKGKRRASLGPLGLHKDAAFVPIVGYSYPSQP